MLSLQVYFHLSLRLQILAGTFFVLGYSFTSSNSTTQENTLLGSLCVGSMFMGTKIQDIMALVHEYGKLILT